MDNELDLIEQERTELDPYTGPEALIGLLVVTLLLGLALGCIWERTLNPIVGVVL